MKIAYTDKNSYCCTTSNCKALRCTIIIAIIYLLMFGSFAVCLTGCSAASTSTSSSSDKSDTKQIIDIYGREVDMSSNCCSVATVGSAARLCVYAGAADKIVAITEMENPDVRRPYTIAYASEFSALPTTSNGNHINASDVDVEKLLELHPDVVFSTRSATECEKLQQKSGIPVVGVYSQDETFGGKLEQSLLLIGEVCGCGDTAKATIDSLNKFKAEINWSKNSVNNNQTKIYRGAINFKGTKGLTGTVSKYCVYADGLAKNVADNDSITGGYDTTIEQIIAWNPDIAVFDCTNIDKVSAEYKEYSDYLQNANAFCEGQTYCVAPFNNNGTNVEYGICEAYYTLAIIEASGEPSTNYAQNIEEKFADIISSLLHKDCWAELKEQGVRFEKLAL